MNVYRTPLRRALPRANFLTLLIGVAALSLIAGLSQVGAVNGGIIYVDGSATGMNTGADWENARTDLQAALAAANSGQEIWIATGTYRPAGINSGDRDASFTIPNGVTIYGGFPSGGGVFEDRNSAANPTIFSGNLGDQSTNTDNSYTVVTVQSGVTATIDGVTITGGNANSASGLQESPARSGGGIHSIGHLNLEQVTIDGNAATFWGGGVYIEGTATISSSTISNNTVSSSGGGVFVSGTATTIIGSTINGNQASRGGGVYATSGTVAITNSTIAGNTGTVEGGGVGVAPPPTVTITSSTISDNTSPSGSGVAMEMLADATFDSSILAGNFGGSQVHGVYSADNTVISDVPQVGPLQDNGGPTETMMPLPGSLVIDQIVLVSGECSAGSNVDQRGVPRPQGTHCDRGAVEVLQGEIYVDQSATGGLNNGTTWENAFTDLQLGLAEAGRIQAPANIFVAGGTYYPTSGTDRDATFAIPDGVSLYGGFAGTEPDPLAALDQRNFAVNETVLSGNLGDQSTNTDNSYSVVTVQSDVAASIDGVTITGGNSVGSGGGVNVETNGTAIITESTIIGNEAAISGGGVSIFPGGDVTLINSTLSGNKASSGGGVSVATSGAVALINSTLSGNVVTGVGGGASISVDATATITDSSILNNEAGIGGGVNIFNTNLVAITNSTISGNTATGTGGGIYTVQASFPIKNTTISGNNAASGGGVHISIGSAAVTNSTISGNTATSDGGGMYVADTGTALITSSILAGNEAGSGPDISGNVNDGGYNLIGQAPFGGLTDPSNILGEDPLLGLLQYNGGPTETMLPAAASPALNQIPQGTNGCGVVGDIDFDQRGIARPQGTQCDIGAVERLAPTTTLTVSAASPIPYGQSFTVTVSVQDNGSPGSFAEGWIVTLSGVGPDRQVTLDASGTATTSYNPTFSGTYLLTGSVGELTGSTSIHILLPPGQDDDDDTSEPPPPVDVEPEEPGGPTLRNVPQHIVLDALTPAGAILTYSVPTSTDVDGSPLEVVCEPPPGTWVPIGHTTVHCSATNSNDITTNASFGVTVRAFQATDFDHSDQIDNPWFWRTWARTDLPVRDLHVSRTWMWGPGPFTGSLWEPYTTVLQNPGGDPVFLDTHHDFIPEEEREVIYFDKARMEINDPDGDPDDLWFVTNGLLVIEMITGNRQFGDDLFIAYEPSYSNVAGDADDLHGPTYASFQGVLDAPAQSVGNLLTEQIDRYGNVTSSEAWGDYNVTVGYVDDVTNHSIAGPFWEFMNSHGLIYSDGNLLEEALFENPFYATGRPVTEAYWAEVKVAGAQRDVLIQCFERRCLTYTPGNSEGFVVEAGNVGQHYYHWRYVQAPD